MSKLTELEQRHLLSALSVTDQYGLQNEFLLNFAATILKGSDINESIEFIMAMYDLAKEFKEESDTILIGGLSE